MLMRILNRQIFPNPMSSIPYDVVRNASIGTLSDVTWTAFLSTTAVLKKRQLLSSVASITTEELVKMCPLNNVVGADVAACCVSGIYRSYCMNPANSTLLAQCHDAYNRAFGASYFKPLGDVCPA